MIKRSLIFMFLSLMLHEECGADDDVHGLIENRRSFVKYIDEHKLKSYLASFGANPTPAETERHEIIKRSSSSNSPSKRKVRRTKKVSTTTTETPIETAIPTKPLPVSRPARNNSSNKNFTVSPRHIVKFEVDDAKYSEEYEKLRQSRKLRVKRSAVDEKQTNGTRDEKLATKEKFVQPREIFKFSLSDAVTKAPEAVVATSETSEKKKRETATDSTVNESKKIHMSSPMRGQRSTKHVSYDEISTKLQKMIDSALLDATQRGKASEGDYLKFFYGDKIIKVPVSLSKYISHKSKESTPVYIKKIVLPSKEESPIESTVYGNKITLSEDDSSSDAPKLLATKNSYYPLKTSAIKFDSKTSFFAPTTEKAESYANFETPIVVEPEIKENEFLPYKKSVYFYTDDSQKILKNSVSSPGPVLFDEPTTPSSIDTSNSHHFKNFIYHPPTKVSIIKDSIPIVEHVDENFSYIPLVPKKSHLSIPLPTSYVEYAGNHANSHDYDKSYEYGYHVSDYKTGNNYGHIQKHNKEETKGEYSILLPDGRVQIVKYIANDSGFHADVSYQNVH